jgi:hypothetical protein
MTESLELNSTVYGSQSSISDSISDKAQISINKIKMSNESLIKPYSKPNNKNYTILNQKVSDV